MESLQTFLISLPWIEKLWADSSPAELYKILSNLQRLTNKV